MKPETDAIAVDLICRLTEMYSEILWTFSDDEEYCSSCGSERKYGNDPVHNENCSGVKIIIEALNYVAPYPQWNPYAKR